MKSLIKKDERTGLRLWSERRQSHGIDAIIYSLDAQPPRALPAYLAPNDAGDLNTNLLAFDTIVAALLGESQ
jgi:hypothetical protein